MKNFLLGLLFIFLLAGAAYLTVIKFFPKQGYTVQNTPAQPSSQAEKENKNLHGMIDTFPLLAQSFDTASPFQVKRVWVQDNEFYVEYQNAKGELGQILLEKNNDKYQAKGYFITSESGWELIKGEGELVSAKAALYEKDVNGNWVRKN